MKEIRESQTCSNFGKLRAKRSKSVLRLRHMLLRESQVMGNVEYGRPLGSVKSDIREERCAKSSSETLRKGMSGVLRPFKDIVIVALGLVETI